jgi:rhamnosyl/mannosyltransferase
MRVLELGKFYPPHHGGMETLLRTYSEGLARRGAMVDCVVASDDRVTRHERLRGVNVHRLASWGTAMSVSICPSYLTSARRFGADLLHLHFPNPLADLACLFGKGRPPLVVSYHSDVVRQAGAMALYRPLQNWLLRRAARILVATPRHIDCSAWLGAWRDKCQVIPFGLDLRRLEPSQTLMQRAAELRASAAGRPIVLNIGRLVGYKGQRYLIEAAQEINAAVWIVGTGPLEEELKAQAAALNVADRVKFWGGVDDPTRDALLQACDVFVLSSITPNEAFALVQVEAMACRKPVICCDIPSGVTYVNQHEITGLIVPPADGPALALALRRLLGDAELCARLGDAGCRRAWNEFEEEVMIDRVWDCFQEVSRAHPAG